MDLFSVTKRVLIELHIKNPQVAKKREITPNNINTVLNF